MGGDRTRTALAVLLARAGRPPVGGPMARRTGRPHRRAELAGSEYLGPADLNRVRAYPVPALSGAVLAAPTEDGLPGALEAHLRERVCAFAWHVDPSISGALRKYGLLHTSLDAPVDERRGARMWLELVGYVVTVGGVPVGERPWPDVRGWDPSGLLRAALPGPIEARIEVATYGNTRYPGVGAPLYI